MHATYSKFTVLTAAALFGAASLTFAADKPASSSASKTPATNPAPEGFVFVEEDTVMLTANEPQNHFVQAEQDIARNDHKAAASELRIAAGYMDMQSSRSEGDEKQKLTTAAEDVRKTADKIAGSKSSDPAELKQAFTKADMALACYLDKKSEAELGDKKPVMAGHDLQAAADAFQSALAWSGNKAPADATESIASADQLADQLITPEPNSKAESSNAQPAGAKMSPDKKTPAADTILIPNDASKTVQALDTCIQKCSSSMNKPSGKA